MENLNLSALDNFRKNVFENADAIIKFNGQNQKLQQKGTFSNANIMRFIRSSGTKAENNAVRTMLLKSLGETFGIQGMTTNADGKVTFSREFMDKLESLLGKQFKRSDFSVGDDGLVKSGKPLTARRVKAIVGKIDELSRAARSGQMPVAGKNRQPQMIEMTDLGSKSEDQKIPYALFKKIYSIARGFVEPQYKNAEEFYADISKNHKEDLFKPFEKLVDKLINKVGEDAVKKAVIEVTGSYDSKTKYSAILSCLMRNDIPAFLGQDDVNVTDLLKYLESRLCHLAVIRDIGGNAVSNNAANKAAPVNAKDEDNSNKPLDKDLAKKMLFEAGNDAKIDGDIVIEALRKDKAFGKVINNFMSKDAKQILEKFEFDKIQKMIKLVTGIKAESLTSESFETRRALLNCLFIKGTESGDKLNNLINTGGTLKDFSNLINERLKDFEKYINDPKTIPSPIDGSNNAKNVDMNAERTFKCSVNLAGLNVYNDACHKLVAFAHNGYINQEKPLQYLNKFFNGVNSLEDYDKLLDQVRNGNASQHDKVDYAGRAFLLIHNIAEEFVKTYGAETVKRIVKVADAGHLENYHEDSRPEIELARVIFSEGYNFNGFDRLLFMSSPQSRYTDDLAGFANVFIDGLDHYAKMLKFETLDSEKLDNFPLDKEMAKELLFDPRPGADYNAYLMLSSNKNFVNLRKHVEQELSKFRVQFGEDKIKETIQKITGVPSDKIPSYSLKNALFNCLFLNGFDSGDKLKALINGDAKHGDLLNLVKERLNDVEGYLKDPKTIPNPVPEKIEEIVEDAVIDHNAGREFKCSVDMAAYEKYDFSAGPVELSNYQKVNNQPAVEYISLLLHGINSLDDYDNVISLLKNNGNVSKHERYNNSVRSFLVLQEITNDFIKVYGEDSVKKIVVSAGGEYSEGSRPEIELAKIIFSSNPKFDGHFKLLGFAAASGTSKTIAGLGHIFIDGLDAHVKALNMKPVNS